MAQVIIKNPSDLTMVFKKRVTLALNATQDIIYKALQEKLSEYYHEITPMVYDRTYKLFNSIIKTEIIATGDGFSCSVEVDPSYLDYTYKGGATGLEVWNWANAKSHGGTVEGNIEVWNNTMDSLGGENGIINLMKQNLQKYGVPVI